MWLSLMLLLFNYNSYYSSLTYERTVLDSELSTCLQMTLLCMLKMLILPLFRLTLTLIWSCCSSGLLLMGLRSIYLRKCQPMVLARRDRRSRSNSIQFLISNVPLMP